MSCRRMNLGSLKLGKGTLIDWAERAIEVAHAEPQLKRWKWWTVTKCFILFPPLYSRASCHNAIPMVRFTLQRRSLRETAKIIKQAQLNDAWTWPKEERRSHINKFVSQGALQKGCCCLPPPSLLIISAS